MELQILILSHGKLCEEIVKSAEMIVGKNPNLHAIPLLESDDHETYCDKIEDVIDSFGATPFIILADIMGGTPFNCSLKLLKKYSFCLVTGLCLGMLLEAYYLDVGSAKEAAQKMLEASQSSAHLFDNNSF